MVERGSRITAEDFPRHDVSRRSNILLKSTGAFDDFCLAVFVLRVFPS